MASRILKIVVGGKEKLITSVNETLDFLSIKVGASALEIKETTGHFDFAAKKLTNLAQGTALGHAVVLDASALIPIGLIPQAALERLVVVADQTARFALTTASAQNGDSVKQTDTGVMYYVKDDTNLGNAAGYEVYAAGTAAAVAWSGVTGTPTTLAGYGITDAMSDAEFTDAAVTGKLLTGFVAGGSYVAIVAADTILQAFNKAQGNFTAIKATADAALPSASFTDSAVTGKLITGFVSGAGTVAATDTILQAINKLDGNAAAVQSPNLSLVNDNAGSITIRQVVYIKSNGAVDLAKADAIATCENKLGLVADASIATTVAGLILVNEGMRVSGFSGLTPGAPVYVSAATAGALTQTAPSAVGSCIVPVGYALSATVIVFEPEIAMEILS